MMYTFDNAFQLAFLVRDGIIAFCQDKENMPCVRYAKNEKSSNPSNESHQFVSTLNPRLIREMISKYKIKKPLLNIDRDRHSDDDLE